MSSNDRNKDRGRNREEDRVRERPSQEHYIEKKDRRPVFDDVTDTLAPPTRPVRRDNDGGNSGW